MTFGAAAALAVAVFATSFLSGIFGLAGGLVLMGALLLFLPVTTAMVLHAMTQMASNGSRAFLWRAHADRRFGSEICGFISTALQLLSGVSGPALDIFLVRSSLGRRAVVATKALCQVATHALKFAYFGVLIGGSVEAIPLPVIALAVVL